MRVCRTLHLAVWCLVLGALAAQDLPADPAPIASTATALPNDLQPAAEAGAIVPDALPAPDAAAAAAAVTAAKAAAIVPDALPAADAAAAAAAVTAAEAAGLGRAVSSTYLPGTAFALVDIPQPRVDLPQPDVTSSAGSGDNPLLPSTLLLPTPQDVPSLPADPVVAPTAIVTPPADYKANLDLHNTYRARHQDTPAMGWDDQVAASALAYAQKCIWGHDGANTQYGENLYAVSAYSDAMKIQYQLNGLKAWYEEIAFYNFNAPAWDSRVGHFTQMVWKGSTALGCAFFHCQTGLTNWAAGRFYLVCRYKPPGNYVNQMAANVMPLITSTPPPTSPPTPPPTPPPSPPPTPPPSTAATVIQANAVIAQSGSTATYLASGPICRFSPNGVWSVCVRHTTGRWELMRAGSTTPTWSAINSWSSTYISNNRPFNLKVDSTGRISIFSKTNTRLLSWSNSNLGVAPYRFEIRDDGKLRIVDSRGVVTWQRPS